MPSPSIDPPVAAPPRSGWMLYDGHCPFCTRSARRVERLIGTRGFAILPLQTPWVLTRLGLQADERPREMVVLTTTGMTFGGADAALHLASHFWWAQPICWLAFISGVKPLMRRIYASIAARRTCAAGACVLPPVAKPRNRT